MPSELGYAGVSRETSTVLEQFAGLVRKWSPRINLIAPTELDRIHDRHIADCLSLVSVIPDKQISYVDLGSGGGFPGVVVAIARPDLRCTLIESDRRKAAFLRTVRRELRLSYDVVEERIEDVPSLSANLFSARALAPLKHLLSHVDLHGASDCVALFLKGKSWREELREAQSDWTFQYRVHEKAGGGVLLEISDVKRDRDAS